MIEAQGLIISNEYSDRPIYFLNSFKQFRPDLISYESSAYEPIKTKVNMRLQSHLTLFLVVMEEHKVKLFSRNQKSN